MSSSFSSQSECRRSITKDLAFYDAAIRSYLQSQLHRPDQEEILLGPVLRIIHDLREVGSLSYSENDRRNVERISWEITFLSSLSICFLVCAGLCSNSQRRERSHGGTLFCSCLVPYLHLLAATEMNTSKQLFVLFVLTLEEVSCETDESFFCVLFVFQGEAADMWRNDSFTNRQKMCKMMRGFYVRAITINRAMGYISSGDHRK